MSGLPPFDPDTGEISRVAFEAQAERVMAQLKLCLEAAGSSLNNVLKCNVYCTPEPSHFAAFNAIYDRWFAGENPARIFVQVPSWPGPFDVEIDCVAVVGGLTQRYPHRGASVAASAQRDYYRRRSSAVCMPFRSDSAFRT